jgi:fructose-bisphosphate aldolase class 1
VSRFKKKRTRVALHTQRTHAIQAHCNECKRYDIKSKCIATKVVPISNGTANNKKKPLAQKHKPSTIASALSCLHWWHLNLRLIVLLESIVLTGNDEKLIAKKIQKKVTRRCVKKHKPLTIESNSRISRI